MPILLNMGLVGEECLFSKFSLAVGVNFQMSEELSEGSYGFIWPLELHHLQDESCLGNLHLPKGQVSIRNNII